MAVITPTNITREDGMKVITWGPLASGDTGAPVIVGNYFNMTVQRTVGAGTCTMEGSNDGSLFGALGAGLAADGTIKNFAERPLMIRPNVTVSSGNTVVLVASGEGY